MSDVKSQSKTTKKCFVTCAYNMIMNTA